MYAIFRAKGKQFRAEPDATVRLPSLEAAPGDRVTFDEVLLASAGGDITVGTPSVAGASVAAEVVRHGKGEKIVVFKMKRRKNYRKKQGHRQAFTEVRIVEIALPGAGRKKAEPRDKGEKEARAEPAAPEPAPEQEDASAETEPVADASAETEPEAAAEVDITDAARDLAEEHGIELATLEGTGKEGRILKSDVERAIQEGEADEQDQEEGT